MPPNRRERERSSGRGEGRAPGEGIRAHSLPFGALPMTNPTTISADYTLRSSELASTLALLVEARQPCVVCRWRRRLCGSWPGFPATRTIPG